MAGAEIAPVVSIASRPNSSPAEPQSLAARVQGQAAANQRMTGLAAETQWRGSAGLDKPASEHEAVKRPNYPLLTMHELRRTRQLNPASTVRNWWVVGGRICGQLQPHHTGWVPRWRCGLRCALRRLRFLIPRTQQDSPRSLVPGYVRSVRRGRDAWLAS